NPCPVRGTHRAPHPRALRHDRVEQEHLEPVRPRAQGGHRGPAAARCVAARGGPREPRRPSSRAQRRDRTHRPQSLQGLLADAREDGRGLPARRLLHHRRPRPHRRGRLRADRGARQGSRDLGWLQHLSEGSRAPARRAARRAGERRHRRAASRPRRGRGGGAGATARREDRHGGDRRRHPRRHRAVQAAATLLCDRRAAAQHHGQGPEERAARALRRRVRTLSATTAGRSARPFPKATGGGTMKPLHRLAAIALALALPLAGAQAETRITYKSAKTGTSYYQMGVQIAEAIKAGTDGNVILTVEESQGSVQNVMEAAVRPGNYVFTSPPALVGSALAGTGPFKDRPSPKFAEIRALFPIPSLTMHFVVRADAGVN